MAGFNFVRVIIVFLFFICVGKASVSADTVLSGISCSGTFTCQVRQCAYGGEGGNYCTAYDEELGRIDPVTELPCICFAVPTIKSCVTNTDINGNPVCTIPNGEFNCYYGDNAASECTFSTQTTCGNGVCEAGETAASCASDCNTCGAGFQRCGGCINGCRPTSQSCSAWITQECSVPPACNPPYWCVGPSQESDCTAIGGTLFDTPWCGTGTRACCSACNNGQYSVSYGCGGTCGACQEERRYVATSNPGIICSAPYCTNNSACTTSSCSPRCGQNNGCGGKCPNTDLGMPTGVTITPTPGSTVPIQFFEGAGYWSQVTWSASGLADNYQMELYPVGTSCSDPNAVCVTRASNTRYYWWQPGADHFVWTVRVRPVNTKCGSTPGLWSESTFTVTGNISVAFYSDPNGNASLSGNNCTDPDGNTSTAVGSGAYFGVETRNGSLQQAISGSSLSLTVPFWPSPNGNNRLTLQPGTSGETILQVTCPPAGGGGNTMSGVSSPSEQTINFFVAALDTTNAGWWQVVGGNINASRTSGQAILSHIPDTCTLPNCNPFMITKDLTSNDNSAGVAVTGGGWIDTSDEAGANTGYVTDRAQQTFAVGTLASRIRENYEYFYREYSMGSNPSNDWTVPNDATKPSSLPTNDKRAYFQSGDLTIQQPWHVAADEEIVVFVDGNLNITNPNNIEQLILVEQGGYLAFIVSGNINIDYNIANADLTNTATNVEGVYIANGQFRVAATSTANTGDNRFVGAGTFVGWNGIVLERDFDDGGVRKVENNTKPTDLFIYRPDFLLNTPDIMLRPQLIWQETN